MTAVLIPTSGEAEWLQARRNGITASEIAVVLGLSPWSSPYALYWEKLGELPRQEDSMAMALGRHLESFVVELFQDRCPALIVGNRDRRYLFAHPDQPWRMATPDGLIREIGRGLDPLAVLEAKTSASYEGWGDDGSDEIPVHIRCQVLWQLDVLQLGTAYVATLFLHSRQLRVYELTMDEAACRDLNLMRIEGWEFMCRLREGRAPDVDWRPATADALKRLHPSVEDRPELITRELARRYRAACKAVKSAERRRDLAANQIRARIGNARFAAIGDWKRPETVARRDVYDLPEKIITRKASTVDRLVPVKPKEPPS